MNNLFLSKETTVPTRERILKTLLTRERCKINELAEAVNINPISVRHHINKLEADGLVNSIEEKQGVGRPHRLYFLTEKGHDQFPTRYLRLTVRLMEQLKETLPQPMLKKLFSQIAHDIASDYYSVIEGLSIEARLNIITELLGDEGFSVEWEKRDDKYLIHGASCPYFQIGQLHPEICTMDQELISSILSLPATKIKCILSGDNRCSYIIHDPKLNGQST